MLTRGERIQVISDLGDHAAPPNTMGGLIKFVFNTVPDRAELGELPIDLHTVSDQASWVIDACLSSRWRRTPSLMELLLTRLVDVGGIGGLAPILARVRNRIDPNPDPFDTLWVLSDQPFLSRPDLRKAARKLVEGINQPILRVNGPSQSGKTYTKELLSFVQSEARPDLHVVPVELAPGTGPTYTVEELAESMALTMEKRDLFPQRSTSSYPKALARWLVRSVNQNSGIWIFVLDGFGQPNMQVEVIEFIQVLAQYIYTPEYARKIRLVLLHFDQDLVGNWRARTLDDGPLPLASVTANDLVDCLLAFNLKMTALNLQSKMIKPEDISTIAAAMIANSQAASSQLPSLYEQLLEIAL